MPWVDESGGCSIHSIDGALGSGGNPAVDTDDQDASCAKDEVGSRRDGGPRRSVWPLQAGSRRSAHALLSLPSRDDEGERKGKGCDRKEYGHARPAADRLRGRVGKGEEVTGSDVGYR